MKIVKYEYPKSSFLSMEKDYGIIVNTMLKNQRLLKLLHYDRPDCLVDTVACPPLTEDQKLDLLGNEIRIIPKLEVEGEERVYLIITFDQFTPNLTNPEFRDNVIEFDIVCHFDQWHLTDFQLRPYKIAAELDTLFNESRLTGIGKLHFIGAKQILLTNEYAGICLMYEAIHSEDDKKKAKDPEDVISPEDEQDMIINFNEIFNKKDDE